MQQVLHFVVVGGGPTGMMGCTGWTCPAALVWHLLLLPSWPSALPPCLLCPTTPRLLLCLSSAVCRCRVCRHLVRLPAGRSQEKGWLLHLACSFILLLLSLCSAARWSCLLCLLCGTGPGACLTAGYAAGWVSPPLPKSAMHPLLPLLWPARLPACVVPRVDALCAGHPDQQRRHPHPV